MPPPYHQPHWNVFSAIPYVPAGPVGYAPAAWAAHHGLLFIPPAPIPLPPLQLDRVAVRAICRDPAIPVLFGYVCAMAWGLQGSVPGGHRHVAAAWSANATIAAHLTVLRAGGLTRCAAYNLFRGAGAVAGLGPAFLTKLLYFFSPEPNFYIMDQWTGKSVDLLTGNWVVRIAGGAAAVFNKCGNYQAYCEELDAMAGVLGVTGEQVEEMLMSKGARRPRPWRAHVRACWPVAAPIGPYNPLAMHMIYPQIPLACW